MTQDQARRYNVAAVLLSTDPAEARERIRSMEPTKRHDLAGLVDWVVEYEDAEAAA